MSLLKNLSKRSRLTLIITLVVFLLAVIFYFNFKSTKQNASIQPSEQADENQQAEGADSGLPMRLKIPSIEIDVPIEYTGLTADGAMAIPKSTDQVGWFELGKRPGENGSAVIAGHYGLYAGKPSAFDNLSKLNEGDKIYIEDDKGATITFVVHESRSYDPTADASTVFSSDDEKSHLNLITCEGTWNKNAKSYSKRLVVFTDKE